MIQGAKKTVATEKNRLSKTLFGALSLNSQRFYWKQADRGCSEQFIAFLHQLHQSFPHKKIALILDNGSIHKSSKVKQFLKKHDWVRLHYLPAYSTEYNPIERFWNWLKKQVYGARAFKDIKELIAQVRKLVWHYHEGNLTTDINFQFDAYADLL